MSSTAANTPDADARDAITVRVVSSVSSSVIDWARQVLNAAVDSSLRDDRFDDSWVAELQSGTIPFVAAFGFEGDDRRTPVGYVGGTVSRGVLRLDALVSETTTIDPESVLDALLPPALAAGRSLAGANGPASLTVELWAMPTHPWHEAVADHHGFVPHRSLQQMRCGLPAPGDALPTRAFEPGRDDEALLRVNNRAFATHPDQGGWDGTDLARRMAEPWFNPEGVRLYEVDGELAGFCWTKVHDSPRLGEIYVIGIDPDFHGRGLGVPMTNAGLNWLADQGLQVGMLYVESDNEPAVRTYERLGFATVRVDRAWVKSG